MRKWRQAEVLLFAQAHMAGSGGPGLGSSILPSALGHSVRKNANPGLAVWKGFVNVCFCCPVPTSRAEALHGEYAVMPQHSEPRRGYHSGSEEGWPGWLQASGLFVCLFASWVSVLNLGVWKELWSPGLSFVNLAKWERSVCLPLNPWATFLHISRERAWPKEKPLSLKERFPPLMEKDCSEINSRLVFW